MKIIYTICYLPNWNVPNIDFYIFFLYIFAYIMNNLFLQLFEQNYWKIYK